jgi:hypothetical protein
METLVYSAITVALLTIWFVLEGKVMTPHDIYRKLEADLAYIPPENVDLMLSKIRIAKRKVEKIHDAAPRTEAGEEALEVLRKLLVQEAHFRKSK